MGLRINLFILFSVLCFFLTGYGQEKRIRKNVRLVGIVVDQSGLKPMQDVVCRSGLLVALTDHTGRFFMDLHPGDSVVFSYVGYRNYHTLLPDTLYSDEYAVGVFLTKDTIQLAEVIIIERPSMSQKSYLQNARRNMQGVGYSALNPKEMDASMNQRMGIEEFAKDIEMKGHVKVGFGVGTQSISAYEMLKLKNKMKSERESLSNLEIDLLKRLYNKEK